MPGVRGILASPARSDVTPLSCCLTGGYSAQVSHNYSFKRGDPVTIVSGRYKRHTGVVDSAVFQRTVDFPEEYAPGYHIVLETVSVITVRWDQVASRG